MINQITADLKLAMKSQDKPRILGLRNLLGKLKAKQIDKGTPYSNPNPPCSLNYRLGKRCGP